MIWSVQAGAKRVPVASIYAPNGTVQLIEGYGDPARVIVVTGDAGQLAPIDQLIEPARNKVDYSLAAGVFSACPDEECLAALGEILDAVIVVPDGEVAAFSRRLALAITTPGEPFHPWCCDWNDMRSLVCGERGVGRAATARASGHSAATDAAVGALEGIGDIDKCRVLSLLTVPQDIKGAQIKQVNAMIGARVGEGDYMSGVLQDPSIPPDSVQVDIFVFGPAALRSPAAPDTLPAPRSGEAPGIPAFLRTGARS